MRRITRATFILIRRILQILDILFHLIISEPIAVFASFCIFKLAVVVVRCGPRYPGAGAVQ